MDPSAAADKVPAMVPGELATRGVNWNPQDFWVVAESAMVTESCCATPGV
ncbi:MAG: hypothetical protein ABSH56_16260 [Bryobacteraceae bacterium]